jgi:hypothetical protein
MRWRHAGTAVVVLTMMTGCPSEFGRDGRVAKAVHQDSLELVRKHCDEQTRKKYCSGGRENTPECIRECG